jgi:hypothetical protein
MPSELPAEFPILMPGTIPGSAADAGVDHTASAIARLAEQYKSRPNLANLLSAFGAQLQDLETAFQQLRSDRALANAFGAQLDVIGSLVKQTREGLADDAYRLRIAARIKLNNSSGSIPEIYSIFRLVLPDATLEIRDEFPAGFTLIIEGVTLTAEEAALMLSLLRQARAGGVRGMLEWRESEAADTFTFDGTSAQALDVGKLKGGAI